MPLLRFDEMVPEVYIKESRDFQVLTRLFTLGLNQAKYNADSIQFLNDPTYVNNRLLTLLQQKVGFYTDRDFFDDAIRKVCKMFYALVRHKGSTTAIIEAIGIFFRVTGADSDAYIDIQNNTHDDRAYTVNIGLHVSVRDISLLEELLKYILPCGYRYTIYFYEQRSSITELFASSKNVFVINAGTSRNEFAGPFMSQQGNRQGYDEVNQLRNAVDTISIAPDDKKIGEAPTPDNWETKDGVN